MPKINKSIHSNCIEFWSFGTDDFFDGILSCFLVVDLFLQEVVEVLEKVVVVE